MEQQNNIYNILKPKSNEEIKELVLNNSVSLCNYLKTIKSKHTKKLIEELYGNDLESYIVIYCQNKISGYCINLLGKTLKTKSEKKQLIIKLKYIRIFENGMFCSFSPYTFLSSTSSFIILNKSKLF